MLQLAHLIKQYFISEHPLFDINAVASRASPNLSDTLVAECSADAVLQIANLERRLAKAKAPGNTSRIPAARCYYRASLELLHQQIDPLASPNGEATPGTERHQELMFLVQSALRIMSSWAQMELDDRCMECRSCVSARDALWVDPTIAVASYLSVRTFLLDISKSCHIVMLRGWFQLKVCHAGMPQQQGASSGQH